jgi:hypothetical protein
MRQQQQCPNCGGYKVDSNVKVKQFGYSTRPMGYRAYIFTWLLFAGFHLFLLGELIYIFRINLGIAAIVAGLFALLILWSKGVRSRLFERKYLDRVPIDAIYRNICQLCDYQWVWRTGAQRPEIHIRPELILQGAERLSKRRPKRG